MLASCTALETAAQALLIYVPLLDSQKNVPQNHLEALENQTAGFHPRSFCFSRSGAGLANMDF